MTHQKLLTIGNSFAGNALTYLGSIGADFGCTWTIGRANIGGCSLEKHWNLHHHSEGEPGFVTYSDGEATGDDPVSGNLRQLLTARDWDIVTLQQASLASWRPETHRPWLDRLVELVRELAPQARIMWHHTWAYRSDAPLLAEWGLSTRQMHDHICSTTADLCAEFGLPSLPSGPALHRAREAAAAYEPDAAFDFGAARSPDLPRQDNSFVIGYRWEAVDTERGVPELRLDPKHLNVRGCYLASATWVEALTGHDVRSSSFCPADLTKEDRQFLANIAHDTIVASV